MSQEGREVAAINDTLADTVTRAIESLHLDHQKTKEIQKALINLVDIEKVYPQSEEALYGDTLKQLQSVSLFDFELEKIISQLLESYFKQLPLFKESYEIAGLRSKHDKYSRLEVDQPIIRLTIPSTYAFAPLSEAKELGAARCTTFEQQQGQSETST